MSGSPVPAAVVVVVMVVQGNDSQPSFTKDVCRFLPLGVLSQPLNHG